MNQRPLALAALIAAAALALPGTALAKNFDKQAKQAESEGLAAVTIFVDATFGNRTHGAAEKLTDAHKAFAQHGYRLIGVEIYDENGDLVGFFVSYERHGAAAGKEPGR